jgi:hypothetical protein
MIAHSTAHRPTIESTAPIGSSGGAAGSFDVGTMKCPNTSAATQIGTLTRNTEPTRSARGKPPRIEPIRDADGRDAGPHPDRPRSRASVNMLVMIDSVAGMMSAADALTLAPR